MGQAAFSLLLNKYYPFKEVLLPDSGGSTLQKVRNPVCRIHPYYLDMSAAAADSKNIIKA